MFQPFRIFFTHNGYSYIQFFGFCSHFFTYFEFLEFTIVMQFYHPVLRHRVIVPQFLSDFDAM